MNHSCKILYNFPEDIIFYIYNIIKKINKEDIHNNFLQEIKCKCIKRNSNIYFKNILLQDIKYKCLRITSDIYYKKIIDEIKNIYSIN